MKILAAPLSPAWRCFPGGDTAIPASFPASCAIDNMSNEYALGFTSLDKETRLSDVPVQGELPAWLRGTLLRTGPAKYETDQQPLRHWFDGYAMLHAFSFGDGKVSYPSSCINYRRKRVLFCNSRSKASFAPISGSHSW